MFGMSTCQVPWQYMALVRDSKWTYIRPRDQPKNWMANSRDYHITLTKKKRQRDGNEVKGTWKRARATGGNCPRGKDVVSASASRNMSLDQKV